MARELGTNDGPLNKGREREEGLVPSQTLIMEVLPKISPNLKYLGTKWGIFSFMIFRS